MLPCCVVHYDTCPRVCLNLTDGSLLKVHFNAPVASAILVAARVAEEPVQSCFCSRSSDSLDHLPRCFTVLNVYNSIRNAANLASNH